MSRADQPPVSSQVLFRGDFPAMFWNQMRNLAERRIRTVGYICVA